MTIAIYKVLLVCGFALLFHSAYSAAQHRTYLRNTDQEFSNLPIDIIAQGITSLLLIMFCILQTSGEFKEIRASVDMGAKSWETFRNIPSFYTFNHRGRALSPNYMEVNDEMDDIE